jgi:flavin-binding protein dodecin
MKVLFNDLNLKAMALIKVIEILAESSKSWEDAAQTAVTEASKTINNIRSVNVKNMYAEVSGGKITSWRLNCKISFEVGNRQ